MVKMRLVYAIPDLQIEWAAKHANSSIRVFLMQVKGFSDRQYRYIMSKAPASDWRCRKEEIQNEISVQKVRRFVNDAAELNIQYVKASTVGLAQAVSRLTSLPAGCASTDLLNLMRTVERSQQVFHSAMGVQPRDGLLQIFEQVKASVTEDMEAKKTQPDWVEKLTYEDIMEFIEFRRENRQKTNLSPVL